MVIGDGILTPAISVLSATGGIRLEDPKMTPNALNEKLVVLVAVAILVVLFSVQHHGTDRKGNGWTSLGGIMLCITGTEALFADLSQFPVLAIQIAFTSIVFPCLLLAYTGQAAHLIKNTDHVFDVFYRSISDTIYWPVFVVATAATIVASQATISATFSLIKQATALGCFPGVKVKHTLKRNHRHIYIPEINWILMVLCVAVTSGFKNQHHIGNACGLAVVIVMLVTTLLMILVMVLVWRCHWILVLFFTGLSLLVEGTYFSSVIFKVNRGGWAPLVIAAGIFIVMSAWHYGTIKFYQFEMHNKVSIQWIIGLGPSLGLVRVPGVGFVYSELASGMPHIFGHFITNLPAIHSVMVFVCVKYLPVYTVPERERFLVTRVGPKNFHMFHCVARYGYKDHRKDDEFEKKLFESLFRFIRLESLMDDFSDSDVYSSVGDKQSQLSGDDNANQKNSKAGTDVDVDFASLSSVITFESAAQVNNCTMAVSKFMCRSDEINELEFLAKSRDTGVVHILGKTVVMARRESEFLEKLVIDYIYSFLRKMCREPSALFNLPHQCLLNVGQVILI
ncbi:hypothetical protein Patl1_12260 [Pistacia atlantica]|uniref:Uncharacterized protein n=1 Tax=Pistacia atlantica TaxID=434234 RepID=A0ACC1A6Q5_9ROSI|nr:hypothetical protein Patl1_12260 [Pistacia atlantica]